MIRVSFVVAAVVAAGCASGQEIDPNGIPVELAWPIFETAYEDLDTCALAEVSGLNPNGDGFLSVRRGPGTHFDRIDKLKNGDQVRVFDDVDGWLGVIYAAAAVDCSPITERKVLKREGALHGWDYGKWVSPLAG